MPLPLILRKRLITRKDNDNTNMTSNHESCSQTQTCTQKTSHESKSNHQAIKKTNCVEPNGIIFNYNIQKSSPHTKNDNKLITKESDNHTIITESDDENNDEPVLDNINIIPNKIFKVVIVDGDIRLVEYNANDIVEENDENDEANNYENGEANNDENENDVELIDTDDHVDANEKRDDSLRNYETTKKVDTGSENGINFVSKKIIKEPNASNQQDNCTVPEVLNHDLQSVPEETNTERDLNKSLVTKLESINGPNSSNNNIHATKKHLAEARKGKAMVLLPLQKYTTLKKKLADIQKEKAEWFVLETEYRKEIEKWLVLEAKRIKEKLDAEKNDVKKNTIGVQTGQHHGTELEKLQLLKNRLAKIFTEAQVNMIISKSKKLKDIVWSDSEMERVVFLKQIISQTAYVFLKYKMHFPLPPLHTVEQWMIKKNIYVKPKRNVKIQKRAESNTTMVGEELNLDSTQMPPPSEPLNPEDIQTLQTNTEVSETAQAVNPIVDDQRPQDVKLVNTHQVHHILSVATDTDTHDNVNNENDANNAKYYNIAPVEEVVQSEEVKSRRVKGEPTIRCRLCLHPFETDEEVSAHVPLHYHNTNYTSYLDAVKPFVCEFCKQPVKHRLELAKHHRTHLGINPLKCWFPGCTYTGKNMIHQPIKVQSAITSELTKDLSNQVGVKSHHDSHKTRSFKCPECGALFKTHKSLRGHRARRHAARALLRCELCPATCLTLYTYRKHVDSHQRPPRIKCTLAGCEELFYCRATLRSHVLVQHRTSTRPHRCHLCPRAHYTTKKLLKQHLQKHETNKISHCVKCLKVFYDYGEYYTHYMEHKDSEHKCKCTCGERFYTQEQLEEHKLQCAFLKGDSIKKYRKRKTENEGNTKEAADTPNRKKAKRKVIININTNSSPPHNNSVVPDKLHEGYITEEPKKNEELNSEENKSFEQKQQELIGAEQKVIILKIKNNQAGIKLENNYLNVTNSQQVISTTDIQLQKYIPKTNLEPRSDKKVHTISPLQQIINANAGSLQQTVFKNAGSQQESYFPVTDNHKVISVPKHPFPKLTIMPLNYQQNVDSVSENISKNLIAVQSGPQKDFLGSCSAELNNVSQKKALARKHYESSEKKVTTNHEIPVKSENISESCPLIGHNIAAKNVEAVSESALKKVIVKIPEMQYQNKIITISNKNIQRPENSIKKQGKQVIKILQTDGTTALKPSNKKVGPILQKNKLQKITVVSHEQLLAALENRQNNLIPISKSIIIKNQTEKEIVKK